MSFILDALRKSEHERQRQTGPALVEVPVAAPRPRTNTWATAAIALLVVNLVAIGVLLIVRSGDSPPDAPVAQTPAQTPAQTSVQTPPSGAPAAAPLVAAAAPEVQGPPPAATLQSSVPQSLPQTTTPAAPPPMLRPAEPAAPATRNPLEREVAGYTPGMEYEAAARAAAPPPGPPAVVAEPRRGGTVVYESLPDVDAMTPAGPARPAGSPSRNMPTADEVAASSGLPELRLELHVYSTRPQERFVFINSAKYREGDTTPEGAAIEEITPDGVVMSARGHRFLLPRD
jgi:general secretion pathway protein B